MRVIGITGGVGAGKSTVLDYLESRFHACVIQADQVGHQVMEPGAVCYAPVLALFGEQIIKCDKTIDRKRVSDVVFYQEEMLAKLNAIIHPAVKEAIRRRLEEERNDGRELVVVEAALLLEDHYEEICDEIWYIHTDTEIRIARLMESRGYTREKAEGIIRSQASEEFFRAHADYVIENNGDLEETWRQIEEGIRRNEIL
ncbi:MAG: dephospho-CoA kinase [Eubacteriales bacterium]|nr:dephospho-CoA kinase [Eubacteriales bacterium]